MAGQAGGVRQRCGRSREDVSKARHRCERSRDVAKARQGCESSREDVTKVRQGCGSSREDVAKAHHRCERSREDVAKARQRCGRSREDVAKHRRPAACTGAQDKKKKKGDKTVNAEDADRLKPSLFRTLGSWLLLRYILSGHRYLGPGNASCRGLEEPVDEDDRIAQEHDRDYELATTKQDVRRADRVAISRFWCNLTTTCNWHSIVGLIIVFIKYAIESLLPRPIYPKLSQHSDERCIQGKIIGAESKTLQGPPPQRCPCPGQYVGRTPQETPGHRMNRPPSPPKYFTDFSVASETSLTYIKTQPTPYTTPGHRMSRPPSPPQVFTFDVPGQPSSRPGTPFVGASSPGSAYYTPQRCPRAPLAQSSPSECPGISPAPYSPGLSPVYSTGDLQSGFNASPDATFSGCPEDETLMAYPADATFNVGPGNETYEPPACPKVKKKPPPLVIQEDLNETFTIRAPGQGFRDSNRGSPHNETFEVGSSLSITLKMDELHNATFEMDRPHNATFEMDCPQGASNSPSGAGLDDCLRERIEQSQERVRGLICKLQALIASAQCKREDLNRTY